MNDSQSTRYEPDPLEISRGVSRRIGQVALMLVVQAAVLFGAAGTLLWPWGLTLLGVQVAGIAASGLLMGEKRRELMAERSKTGGMPAWDRWIGGLWGVTYFILELAIAGLDYRFGWSGLTAPAWHLLGLAGYLLGAALFAWAMRSNAYFASVSRVQAERGQTVCDSGPYRLVRHPGYLGAILQGLAIPLFLGTFVALLPAILAAGLMALRTVFEDRMLRRELPGYAAYAGRVRARLLPGVW